MSRFRPLAAFGLVLSACAAPPLLAAPAERPVERAFGAEVRAVELENLAGRVEIRRAAAGAGRLTAIVRGDDSAGKTGRQWVDALEVEVEQRGARLIVKAYYPLDDHQRYHYPELGKKARIEPSWLEAWVGDWNTSAEYQGRRVKVSGRASSSAPTLWADFTLEVPEGISVSVKNLVGHIHSTGVAGGQVFESSSGDIDVSGARGELDADTGSGDVFIADHEGDVAADTGSGDVELAGVRASRISADTGSGDVRLERCTGAIQANTGSGDIVGRGLVVGQRLEADTGSGDVKLSGDFGAVRDMTIDTGSGDVSLVFAAVPSVQLVVSTGSGDIDVDVGAMRVRRSRDEFVADLAGAEGIATIDTGSGDVIVSEGADAAESAESGHGLVPFLLARVAGSIGGLSASGRQRWSARSRSLVSRSWSSCRSESARDPRVRPRATRCSWARRPSTKAEPMAISPRESPRLPTG